jgi:hypothetical protein
MAIIIDRTLNCGGRLDLFVRVGGAAGGGGGIAADFGV